MLLNSISFGRIGLRGVEWEQVEPDSSFFLSIFKAIPRNSDGAIAKSNFSSDDTKIRRR